MNIPQIKSSFRPVNDIVFEGYAPNVISTAIELGLFDVLAKGAMNASGLTAKLATVENLTEAFANSLAALRLLQKNGADYSLAPVAADFLVKSSPAYQGGMIAMSSHYGQVMSQMPRILRDGPAKFDTDMWDNANALNSMG